MSSSSFETIITDIIADCPPGEIKEVYNDLIAIAGENSKETILDVIEQYNIRNKLPVDVEGHSIIISEYNKDGSNFIDPINGLSFTVDHLNQKSENVQTNELKLNETQQKIINNLKDYTSKDFPGKVTYAIYELPNETDKYAIIIVSTRDNSSNFWNGHWKSEYIFDASSKSLTGKINIQVHYYEDGNVNFKSTKEIDEEGVTDVVKVISEFENSFERELDTSFTNLNEKQFKNLRRRLPITRSKVNWGKAIGTYRLGRDAAEGKQ